MLLLAFLAGTEAFRPGYIERAQVSRHSSRKTGHTRLESRIA